MAPEADVACRHVVSWFRLLSVATASEGADRDSVMKLLANVAAPVLSPPHHTHTHTLPYTLIKAERLFYSSSAPFLGPLSLGGFPFTPFSLRFHLLSSRFLALSSLLSPPLLPPILLS